MDSMTFVLSTGDLAKRKIFPALYNLYLDQKNTATNSFNLVLAGLVLVILGFVLVMVIRRKQV